ncbi:MAG TPA: prolyl-tRNA editing protein [Elusimicrobia bacterium]|nr:prolyl-tRNA editing protein [Elusimicrobiota bacterium]
MNKNEIYTYLKNNNIWHEITAHKVVLNMSEISNVVLPYPECCAKNLFVRDDKKRNYYLITVKGNKQVNLKEFKQKNGTRSLSFASENDLLELLHLLPGSVTPLGILNDKEHKVQCFLDKEFLDEPQIIGIHPNENTATVWLKIQDLIKIITKHKNIIKVIDI